jgi:hypothetical protein
MTKSLFAISLILLVIAAGTYRDSTRAALADGLEVEQPVRDVGSHTLGEVISLDFRVVNHSGRTLRILGFSGGCTPGYCIGSSQAEQIPVVAGGTQVYAVEVTVRALGRFDAAAELLLESLSGVQPTVLRVVGEVETGMDNP